MEGNENAYIIIISNNIVYEADPEKVHEFVKPLTPNK